MLKLAYCDYIAKMIFDNAIPDNRFITEMSSPRMDLHPTEGYFMSTKKVITMHDRNGKAYVITVEEAPMLDKEDE